MSRHRDRPNWHRHFRLYHQTFSSSLKPSLSLLLIQCSPGHLGLNAYKTSTEKECLVSTHISKYLNKLGWNLSFSGTVGARSSFFRRGFTVGVGKVKLLDLKFRAGNSPSGGLWATNWTSQGSMVSGDFFSWNFFSDNTHWIRGNFQIFKLQANIYCVFVGRI